MFWALPVIWRFRRSFHIVLAVLLYTFIADFWRYISHGMFPSAFAPFLSFSISLLSFSFTIHPPFSFFLFSIHFFFPFFIFLSFCIPFLTTFSLLIFSLITIFEAAPHPYLMNRKDSPSVDCRHGPRCRGRDLRRVWWNCRSQTLSALRDEVPCYGMDRLLWNYKLI